MKFFLKPSVKPSERFFVSREAGASAAEEGNMPVSASVSDDVVVSAGGVEQDGSVVEFLLGVSMESGRERLLKVSVPGSADAWNGAVALELQRELKRGHDVFVLHDVVSRLAGVEAVTMWSVEVHVVPDRVSIFETAAEKSPVKLAARVQSMAELAWSRVCARDNVPCGLPVPVVAEQAPTSAVVVDTSPLTKAEELMMMIPDGWEPDDARF